MSKCRSSILAVLVCFLVGTAVWAAPGEVRDLRLSGVPDSELSWQPLPGSVQYEVIVSPDPSFSSEVQFLGTEIAGPTIHDGFIPPPGGLRAYLVRAVDPSGAGPWGAGSDGLARLNVDEDGDEIPDIADNCLGLWNPIQSDIDNDGVGDLCDNCPTEANPGQEDGNNDGGGDACQPSPMVTFFCEDPFVPDVGVDQRLLDPELPHPELEGVVHPVIQFSMALMEPQRRDLEAFGVVINESIDFNLGLVSIQQGALEELASLPFVRSIFPVPACYGLTERSICDPLENASWQQLDPASAPSSRALHAAAQDHARSVTVVFGGDQSGGGGGFFLNGETWEFDGAAWNQASIGSAVTPRAGHAMAWFERDGVTVLHGGLASVGLGSVESDETWLWDGTTWTFAASGDPSARRDHGMAYDREREEIVLFGGVDAGGAILSDTWLWEGSSWVPVTPANSPSPRTGHAMAWEQGSQRVLLYGGRDSGGEILSDLWAWDGIDWEQIEFSGGPGPRDSHAMTSRWDLCGIVLHGGLNAQGSAQEDTWFWSGSQWIGISTVPPTRPRFEHTVNYDAQRGRYVLFGGNDAPSSPRDETWDMEPSTLYDVVFHQTVPDSVASSILAAANGVVVEGSVDIPGGQRVNTWAVAIPDSQVAGVEAQEPVLHVQGKSLVINANDGSRTALNVDAANLPPYCAAAGCDGTGITVAEWDGGWAGGDNTFTTTPPLLPTGATHTDLVNRVTIRDWDPNDPLDPTPSAACAGVISCSNCYVSDHATHVSGTIMGDGTTNPALAGMAPGVANNISYNWQLSSAEIACELDDAFTNFNALVANNSWSLGWNNATASSYDAASQAFDQQIVTQPEMTVFFAAANNQQFRPVLGGAQPPIYTPGTCTPPPPGVTGPPAIPIPPNLVARRFFSIPQGQGQIAKNTVTVGAISSGGPSAPANFGRMTHFSSWGPTRDGRIKPDLVAPGSEDDQRDLNNAGTNVELICGTTGAPLPPICDPDPQIASTVCDTTAGDQCLSISSAYGATSGTSMASPAAAGVAALLLQEDQILGPVPGDTPLDSDSVKAMLIHTATDLPVHVGGPNFMGLGDCDGDTINDDCWPVPPVVPGTIQDGPDYANGWGLINATAALDHLTTRNPQITLRPSGCANSVTYTNMPFNSPLAIGGDPASIGIAGCSTSSIWDWVGYINVPSGTNELKVTIAWNDPQSIPPALASTTPLLINDLDLIVTPYSGIGGSPTGPHNYGWMLDPACPYLSAYQVSSNTWSPATYSDQRNTVEQVIVQSPAAGTHRIVVQGIGLATPTQPFAIMISLN